MYWLVKATGTNRGIQGCVQSLSINGKMIDMRPWPLGKALSGADVGKCNGVGFSTLSSAKPVFCLVEKIEQWSMFERGKVWS